MKIPGDFSLMSLDYIPGSEYLPVPLTTVNASNGDEASLLLELLWGDSNGQGTRKERIAPHLQPRSSTAAPPRASRKVQLRGSSQGAWASRPCEAHHSDTISSL